MNNPQNLPQMKSASGEPAKTKRPFPLSDYLGWTSLDVSGSMGQHDTDEGKEEAKKLLAEVQNERQAKDRVQARLEQRYADRGLKFTSGFRGACPMQAFGIIDGMRFYFRYRNGHATLRIGEMDPENHRIRNEAPNGIEDYPTIVHFVGSSGTSSLDGYLSADQAEEKFIDCMENMQDLDAL